MSRQVLFTLALLALTAYSVSGTNSQPENYRSPGMLKVGEKVETNLVFAQGVEHSEIITAPKATYIAVHFSDFKLNTGDIVIVRSPDAKTAFTYGAEGVYGQSSFVADLVPGESAVIEYFPASTSAASGQAFRINEYSRGVSLSANQEAVCGNDDMVNAKCLMPGTLFAPIRPLAYERGLAVARLLVEGSHACTGWLVGSAGHLMTNAHCVEDEAMANRMHVEFAAESGSCFQKCEDWLACKGQTVTLTTKLVARNRDHDYAVLKLPDDVDLWPYGFLTLRKEGAAVDEEIYIPNHARAWGKRLAIMNDGKMIKVDKFAPAGQCAQNGLHFTGDIQGGASGSPAIGASDNKVVGIVSCHGYCPYSDVAEDIRLIIADLESKGVVIPDAY
ncbi:hypothetical protein ATCC90586_009369 [Pythium insidiosum]|nr:hypothetical protein ATCC90586_009369 [Pythium insidiosum]